MIFQKWRARLDAIRNKTRKEAELAEEIQFHLDEEAEQRLASGASAKNAELAARKDFGNVAKVRESTREAWGVSWMDGAFTSLFKHAVRNVAHSPRLSFTAVLCIAVAMAATSAAITLVSATLWRPLPFQDADRLARVWLDEPGEDPRIELAYPELRELGDSVSSFDGFEAAGRTRFQFHAGGSSLEARGSRRVEGEAVTSGYFELLGVEPLLGRLFSEAEHREGGERILLLSYQTWGAYHGFDPDIVGQRIHTQDGAYEIIGVLPETFPGSVDADSGDIEFWIPILRYLDADARARRDLRIVWSVAHLAPGATLASADAELKSLSTRLGELFPESYDGRAFAVESLAENWRSQVRRGSYLLLAAALLVLIVAAANVAVLLLARSIDQRRQWAVRLALGAGRRDVALLASAETAILVGAGSALGLVAGPPLLRALLSSPVNGDGSVLEVPVFVHFAIDPMAAAACGLFFLAVALIAACGPVLQCAKLDVREAIQDTSRSAGGPRGGRWFRAMVITEVALATVLAVGASLLLRSFQELSSQELGFRSEGVLRIGLFVNDSDVGDAAELPAFHARVRETVLAQTGVRKLGVVWPTIPIDWPVQTGFRAPGLELPPSGVDPRVDLFVVDAHTFDTLDMRLVAGRGLAPNDDAMGAPVAIVNRALARTIAGVDTELERVVGVEASVNGRNLRIVGIVEDTRFGGPKETPGSRHQVFLPYAQSPRRTMSLLIATEGDPEVLVAPLRQRLVEIAPTSALDWIGPVDRVVAEHYLLDTRFLLSVLGAFTFAGLFLSAIGLFAVLADSVARQRGEIGLRQALGASPSRVLSRVLLDAALVVSVGMAAGLVLSWMFRQSLASMLYGVSMTDVRAHLGALVAMIAVAALATLIPALRAAAIAPAEALRER